jgi:hypothetical protein
MTEQSLSSSIKEKFFSGIFSKDVLSSNNAPTQLPTAQATPSKNNRVSITTDR